jgi:hypothetical protein
MAIPLKQSLPAGDQFFHRAVADAVTSANGFVCGRSSRRLDLLSLRFGQLLSARVVGLIRALNRTVSSALVVANLRLYERLAASGAVLGIARQSSRVGMQPHVRCDRRMNLQIGWSIVEFVVVFVMHNFGGSECPPDDFGHHQTMFKHHPVCAGVGMAYTSNQSVAGRCDRGAVIPRWIPFSSLAMPLNPTSGWIASFVSEISGLCHRSNNYPAAAFTE